MDYLGEDLVREELHVVLVLQALGQIGHERRELQHLPYGFGYGLNVDTWFG